MEVKSHMVRSRHACMHWELAEVEAALKRGGENSIATARP